MSESSVYTDFIENFSVYSDVELRDWIRASYLLPQPYFIMSLNAVIAEIDEKYLNEGDRFFARKEPTIYLGMSQVYESSTGNMVVCSLPKNTYSIILIPPMIDPKESDEYLQMVQITPPKTPVVIKMPPNE